MQMIPVSSIPDKAFAKARQLKPPVTRLSENNYAVRCAKGHGHLVRFSVRDGKLLTLCDRELCPARVGCYHMAAALDELEFDNLQPGMRVLVSEGNGPCWHTFVHADERYVYTFEIPCGFRRVFVIDYERLVTERRAAA